MMNLNEKTLEIAHARKTKWPAARALAYGMPWTTYSEPWLNIRRAKKGTEQICCISYQRSAILRNERRTIPFTICITPLRKWLSSTEWFIFLRLTLFSKCIRWNGTWISMGNPWDVTRICNRKRKGAQNKRDEKFWDRALEVALSPHGKK